jgi:hypothetical protein
MSRRACSSIARLGLGSGGPGVQQEQRLASTGGAQAGRAPARPAAQALRCLGVPPPPPADAWPAGCCGVDGARAHRIAPGSLRPPPPARPQPWARARPASRIRTTGSRAATRARVRRLPRSAAAAALRLPPLVQHAPTRPPLIASPRAPRPPPTPRSVHLGGGGGQKGAQALRPGRLARAHAAGRGEDDRAAQARGPGGLPPHAHHPGLPRPAGAPGQAGEGGAHQARDHQRAAGAPPPPRPRPGPPQGAPLERAPGPGLGALAARTCSCACAGSALPRAPRARPGPQTLRYLDLEPAYKQELLSYRIKTLNEGLRQAMEDPDLGLPKPGRQRQEAGAAVLAGFVPSIQPGGA